MFFYSLNNTFNLNMYMLIFLTMMILTSFLYFFFMPSPNFHYNKTHPLNLKQR